MDKIYDIIIIGAGPAGITAGIYAVRAGIDVLVLDNGESSLEKARVVENYYGFDKISGKELKQKGINQYVNLGGQFKEEEVLSLEKDYKNDLFIIETLKMRYNARALILATGTATKKTPKVFESNDYENVSYCAVCDGFLYRGKDVVVVGNGAFAKKECEYLKNIAKTVYLITDGQPLSVKIDKDIKIIDKKIVSVVGQNKVDFICLEDDSKLKADCVFIAQGSLSSFGIAKKLGLFVENNSIVVENYQTNIDGVFAAGDIVGGLLQISKAVSDGAQAGLNAVKYLKKKD